MTPLAGLFEIFRGNSHSMLKLCLLSEVAIPINEVDCFFAGLASLTFGRTNS